MRQQPIGIFDSGIGGLPIAEQIQRLLPNEQLIYFADTKFAPYGEKSEEFILQRAETITNWFISQDVKAIVVACNTATMVAIQQLRANFALPFIGVEPGVKPGAIQTKTGVIGVLATPKTLSSLAFHQLAARVASDIQVEMQPCPKFVHLVESLQLEPEQTLATVQEYLAPLLAKNVDTIILGCTHFAHLAEVIKQVAGDQINLISTEQPVALEVKRRLTELDLLANSQQTGGIKFFTNGDLTLYQSQLQRLWHTETLAKHQEV